MRRRVKWGAGKLRPGSRQDGADAPETRTHTRHARGCHVPAAGHSNRWVTPPSLQLRGFIQLWPNHAGAAGWKFRGNLRGTRNDELRELSERKLPTIYSRLYEVLFFHLNTHTSQKKPRRTKSPSHGVVVYKLKRKNQRAGWLDGIFRASNRSVIRFPSTKFIPAGWVNVDGKKTLALRSDSFL